MKFQFWKRETENQFATSSTKAAIEKTQTGAKGIRKRKKMTKTSFTFTKKRENIQDVMQNVLKLSNDVMKIHDTRINTLDHKPYSPEEIIEANRDFIKKVMDGTILLHPLFSLEYRGLEVIFEGTKCFVGLFESRFEHKKVTAKFIYKEALEERDFCTVSERCAHIIPIDLKRYLLGDKSLPKYIYFYESAECFIVITEVFGHAKKPADRNLPEKIFANLGMIPTVDLDWDKHYHVQTFADENM